jgi:hypothetical protein
MTEKEIACWNLMASSLRNVLPFIEAVALSECAKHLSDLPYGEMAYGLGYVIALEELIRPVQERKLVN